MKIRAFHPVYCSGTAISHICMSLCEHMGGPGMDVEMFVPARDRAIQAPFLACALPRVLTGPAYRIWHEDAIAEFASRRFVSRLDRGEIAYVWPGSPEWLYRKIKDRGNLLVMERINTHRRTARRILDDAYMRVGLTPTHGLTQEDTECEDRKLNLADFVYCPSPNVTNSVIEAGVPETKVLRGSYGWDPARVRGGPPALPPVDGLTALFLGRICIRKGAHLLLDAWVRSGVKGRVVLVGSLDDELARLCADHLKRPDVTVLPFTDNIAPVLSSADLFAFPTLEEGSPLVVYEALAAALPVLTTEMGGGEIVRDGVEGYLHGAYDGEAWAERLRDVASRRDDLRAMGVKASARAAEFTWERAGRRRGTILREALAPTRADERSHLGGREAVQPPA